MIAVFVQIVKVLNKGQEMDFADMAAVHAHGEEKDSVAKEILMDLLEQIKDSKVILLPVAEDHHKFKVRVFTASMTMEELEHVIHYTEDFISKVVFH